MQIITTHKAADFDALASVIAGTILYPGAIPVLPKNLNPNVKAFLSIHKDLFKIYSIGDIELDKVKTLIVTDANSWNRLEKIDVLRKRDDLEIILWDHHKGGNIQPTWKCKKETGATITLMVQHMKQLKMELTPMQATLFLAGLYEDTGGLMFPSTTAEDAYAAGYLLEKEADLKILNSFLRPAYGQKQKTILFEMLKTASRIKLRGFSISISKMNMEGHVSNLAVVVHMYREILNLDAAFGVFTVGDQGKCIVIGRSSVDELNIGKIMHKLGGGGHLNAGSAKVDSLSPNEIEKQVISLIKGDRLATITISDLMSYPVYTVTSDMKMEQVAQILREKGCTGVPVVEGDKMVGVISRRDFKKVRRTNQMKAPVKAFMSRNCITIESDRSPVEASRLMVKHDIGRLPVIQKERIIGIITRTDAMRYFYDLLPE